MKLLLDEMLDQRLVPYIAKEGHECISVKAAGLKGLSNGALLNAAELRGVDVLLTVDQNIQYQTNFSGRRIAVVIICVFKNKLSYILPHLPEVLRLLPVLKLGEINYMGEPRLVSKRTQP